MCPGQGFLGGLWLFYILIGRGCWFGHLCHNELGQFVEFRVDLVVSKLEY